MGLLYLAMTSTEAIVNISYYEIEKSIKEISEAIKDLSKDIFLLLGTALKADILGLFKEMID
ncbi:MAG: hypothetical protein DRN26_04420 [Thermoplasmata archaeon]|nr:MAG: hypothetical protein DRN26_04420 [Thermoplasmata archaeon]